MFQFAAILSTLVAAASMAPPDLTTPTSNGDVPQEVTKLPMAFVENAGQWNTPASFVASTRETMTCVEEGGFLVVTQSQEEGEGLALRFDFEGARSGARPVGEDLRPGLRNYFLGNDPEQWRTGVRGFARVVYPDLYEGIDLHLREADGRLEYDLCLAPGADVSSVVVRCEGVEGLELDEAGGLSMQSAQGPLRQTPPQTWCVLPSGEKQPLECEFVVLDATSFSFRLAERDPSLPVVIDPGLEWATYLGGTMKDDAMGMVRKPNGEIVVAGYTKSPVFPVGLNPAGDFDAFVSIFDPTGSTLLYSTLLGDVGQDLAMDVQVNAAGEVFVVGGTASTNFPVIQLTAYMPAYQGGGFDAWLMVLSPTLIPFYGTFLGGGQFDMITSIHVREPRIVTACGTTRSSNFPTTPGAMQSNYQGGFTDYFLCRLDVDQPPSAQLSYSTYVGGSGQDGNNSGDLKCMKLHEDAAGIVTVTARTGSMDIPTTANAFDSTYDGQWDVYLARIDPSQAALAGLLYGTYIGGNSQESDGPNSLAVDSAGVITLGGFTYSSTFPTTPGAYETAFAGPAGYNDAFILRLDPNAAPANQLLYSTFLTGDGWESVGELVIDSGGRVVAQGFSGRDILAFNSFPTTCSAFEPNFVGSRDGFIVYLDPAGNGAGDLLYSTFLGGAGWDILTHGLEIVSEVPTLKVVACGGSGTSGGGFPTTPGAFQPNPAGSNDVLLLQLEINPHTYCTAASNTAGPDGAIICGNGEVSLTRNAFELSVSGAPPQKFGLFFYSNAANQMPFGEGTMCVALPLQRVQPVLLTDPVGSTSLAIDFSVPPFSSGPFAVLPNTTWYFQFWYRDPQGGPAGFNVSNGLKAHFYP